MEQDKQPENGRTAPLLFIAKFKFDGRNTDELSFAKNDVITVTQQLEGGWWEGSLDGRVGWFPSNFVGIVNKMATNGSANSGGTTRTGAAAQINAAVDARLEANRITYRTEQIKLFMDKEQENLQKIDKIWEVLRSLKGREGQASNNEFVAITTTLGNFVTFKRALLSQFEEQIKKPLSVQAVGKLFLDAANELRSILHAYCEKHCDLLEFLNRETEFIQQQLTAHKLDFKELIVGLSLIFRHVEKYATMLQEIERNTPENHSDRGNLQRAALVYRDFYNECLRIRKQRDAQIDFLQTDTLTQIFGPHFEQQIGQFLFIGKVTAIESAQGTSGENEADRCIAVFEKILLLLELQLPCKYTLKHRLATSGLNIWQREQDNEIQFDVPGQRTQLILKAFGKEEYGQLIWTLKKCVGSKIESSEGIERTETDRGGPSVELRNNFNRPLEKAQIPPKSSSSSNIRFDHQLGMILPDGVEHSPENGAEISRSEAASQRPYSGWSLRPLPPFWAEWQLPATNTTEQHIKMRKGLTAEEQEDALMLKMVSGYCISGASIASPSTAIPQCCGGGQHRPRQCHHQQHQRNSAESCHSPMCGGGPVRRAASFPEQHEMANRPQLIVAEDEKLFVEEMEGDQLVIKERSLVDTVYALKDQISTLSTEVGILSKALEQEQRARRRIEEFARQQQPVPKPNTTVTNGLQQPEKSQSAINPATLK